MKIIDSDYPEFGPCLDYPKIVYFLNWEYLSKPNGWPWTSARYTTEKEARKELDSLSGIKWTLIKSTKGKQTILNKGRN